MRHLLTSLSALVLLAAVPAAAQGIEITPNGSQSSTLGPAENFTGHVVVDPLFGPNEEGTTSAGHITFAPGARAAWHSHPAGQTLIVTSGTGWIQEWEGEKREIRPGDVIWIPAGVKHWHGATDTTSMRHIAVQEAVDGSAADWMEQVTDAQYLS